ncbi:MAG: RNA polymerase sigma factor [Mycobacteriales bacterium]
MNASLRAGLRAGDPAAFARIFDSHSPAIYRHAMRLTGQWATAEDIVSLTFLEVWRLRDRINPEGESLTPWLFGIATNVIRNTTRAARRHRAVLARMPVEETVPDVAVEITDLMDDEDQARHAREALATLRRSEREVFTLVVWAGLDYAAAAEALGIPAGTVRSRLSRTRTKLRNLLENREPPSPHGQVTSSRDTAVRSVQEYTR